MTRLTRLLRTRLLLDPVELQLKESSGFEVVDINLFLKQQLQFSPLGVQHLHPMLLRASLDPYGRLGELLADPPLFLQLPVELLQLADVVVQGLGLGLSRDAESLDLRVDLLGIFEGSLVNRHLLLDLQL